jgi:hypothetical protein
MRWIILFLSLVSFSLYAKENPVMQPFNGSQYRYTISYPSDWRVYDHRDGVVVFKYQPNKTTYPVSVNIQTIFTKKEQGSYASVKDLMDDFVKNAKKHTDDAVFSDRKPFSLDNPQGETLQGEQATLTYRDHGKTIKHWQVMLITKDGSLFQAWAYRAPEDVFQTSLPLAKDMLATWIIQ